jgi:aminoglycoside phosphotransferase (APT) family kinase protein
VHKDDITVDVVACLIRGQFPDWAGLEIRPVELDGWDNTTFRLGDAMSVRLPSHERYVPQIAKEYRWLPVLADHLPLPIPTPMAKGVPACGFPRAWSIYSWLDGEPAALVGVRDLDRLAEDLGDFLTALHRVPVDDGPIAGPHSFDRGGPVAVWDDATRAAINQLEGRIDTSGALEVWDAALAAPLWTGPDVWVHGDMMAANLIVRDDRLCGVIDFGCSAIGDPACDLTLAWTTFEGSSRTRFMQSVPVDRGAWARARGWALWKAVVALPTLPEDDPRNDGTRFGWRWTAIGVVDQIINDFRAGG